MKQGLLQLLGNGVQFFSGAAASVYVGLRLSSSPASSFYLNLPTALPGSTQALVCNSSGDLSFQALGGGGTVTSVSLSLPSIFNVTTATVTSSGTLTAALNSQTANTFFAAPNGSAGAPSFRAIVAADVPKTLDSTWLTDFNTAVRLNRLDQLAAPTASVSLNSQRLTGLADPVAAQDAATKAYVDATVQGLDIKASVRVASTANVAIAAPGTAIDGITLSNGDRVLLKDQSTGSQNGIYVFNGSGSAMTRATDADTSAKVTGGMFTFVKEGTANADSGWVLTTDGTITLGTTAITFTQFSGAGQITAGNGLAKTGNTLDVTVDNSTLEINADTLRVRDLGITNAKIAAGTIDLTAKVTGSLPVANGGTGATSAANARTNLGTPGIYRTTFTNASLVGGVLTITHSLGNKVCSIQISDNSDKVIIPDDVTLSSTTQAAIDLTSFGTLTGTWNVIAVG